MEKQPSARFPTDPGPGKQAGFSLIEILTALAILSFSLAVLMPALANNLRIGDTVRTQSIARLHIQSLLAEIGVTKPLEPGEQSGDYGDGTSWGLQIEPYGSEAEQARWPVAAYRVTATVSWPARGERMRFLTLTTLRAGPKATP
jgi:general secretion pathway protein I